MYKYNYEHGGRARNYTHFPNLFCNRRSQGRRVCPRGGEALQYFRTREVSVSPGMARRSDIVTVDLIVRDVEEKVDDLGVNIDKLIKMFNRKLA